jgi:hypothetical protein
MNMVKKLVLIALLALQTAAVCNIVSADLPWPHCMPCPGDSTVPPSR